jgi:large subunit ribosomal protein L4
MSVTTYTKSGAKASTAVTLDKDIFNVSVKNHELIKQAYVAYLANGRENLAVTKTRGLVSGGGKKPWKQKGTGRARFGSSRVPIWRGGGITFGPTGLENYTQKINLKAKRLAVRQALSLSAQADKLVVIESLDTINGKTSEIATILQKIGAKRRTLIVVDKKTPELIRATANLSEVKVVQATYLNVYDVINAHHVVITKKALPVITQWLSIQANDSSPSKDTKEDK